MIRRIRLGLICVLAVILVPYGFSRLAATSRRVSVHVQPEHSQSFVRGKDTLRVACYNIAHGRGLAVSNWEGGNANERRTRLEEIAEQIKALDADIVILNEVDFDASWSYSVNQAEYLAERCGYGHRTEQRNLDFRVLGWTWRFGNAILSKHPILDAEVIDLPAYSNLETVLAGKKRGVVCTIEVDGRPVRVFGVHLSHRSEEVRVRSAELLVDLALSGSVPVIIAGDLNSTPAGFPGHQVAGSVGNALDILDASGMFQRRPMDPPKSAAGYTYRSDQPRSVIDWILIPESFEIVEHRVVSSLLSDHRPVVTTARWSETVPPRALLHPLDRISGELADSIARTIPHRIAHLDGRNLDLSPVLESSREQP